VRGDQSRPLHDDEFEVLDSQEHEVAPHTEIVKYFYDPVTVEMPKYGVIQIRLISQVDEAEIAGVVAETAGDKDDDEADGPTGSKCKYWQKQDESSDHPVDHPDDGHLRTQLLILMLGHIAINIDGKLI